VLVGGKSKNSKSTKSDKKTPKKRVVKKPISVTTKKKTIKKKVVKGGAKYLEGESNLGKIWNSMFIKKIKKEKSNSTKVEIVKSINNNNNNNNNNSSKTYALFVIDMQNDFCDVPYKRNGKVRLVSKSITGLNKGTPMTTDKATNIKCRKFNSKTVFKRNFTEVSKNELHSVPDLEDLRDEEKNAIGNFNVADSGKELTDNLV
ncbi:MAG: hypothetical protein VXZ92_12520, partial [SAR324 cluster bacterium]|nr:hypothetical protein [SAR324 cluster bacterium]